MLQMAEVFNLMRDEMVASYELFRFSKSVRSCWYTSVICLVNDRNIDFVSSLALYSHSRMPLHGLTPAFSVTRGLLYLSRNVLRWFASWHFWKEK